MYIILMKDQSNKSSAHLALCCCSFLSIPFLNFPWCTARWGRKLLRLITEEFDAAKSSGCGPLAMDLGWMMQGQDHCKSKVPYCENGKFSENEGVTTKLVTALILSGKIRSRRRPNFVFSRHSPPFFRLCSWSRKHLKYSDGRFFAWYRGFGRIGVFLEGGSGRWQNLNIFLQKARFTE